jgi:glycosyltransferase involved in cell wall biosynthesis
MLFEANPYPQDVRLRMEAESLVAAGYAVEVVVPRARGERRRERVRGVDVFRFFCFDGSSHGAKGFLAEYLVAAIGLHRHALRALLRGTTVLHVHNPPDLLFPAAWMFRLAGRKVIFDHHDLGPETVEVKFGAGMFSRIARICERLTFAASDHVIATNDSYAEIAYKRGRKTPAQVTIVRNAPPRAWVEAPLQAREGILETVEIVYVGAISTQDGVEGLAPVLARLSSDQSGVSPRLTIVGDGDGRAMLDAELARLNVAHLVTITGWVHQDRVPELIQEADVCVDPAPATDVNDRSTMTKIAEYMAFGKPVVAYELRETKRTTAGAALLVPPGDADGFADAIVRLAKDPALRAEISAAARRRAGEISWDESERSLLAAFTAVAEPGPV